MTQNSARTGKLYVVGTPIGNLGDLSPRVGEAFAAADAVCCEDTRVTSKLLMHLGISKPLVRCDENVIASCAAGLVDRLLAGETLAFASDAGMPSVSDPGRALVEAAREADVPVVVVPGPSACVTALVSSGIPCEHFFFEGFLGRKHGDRVRHCSALPSSPARSSSTSLHIASWRRSRPWPRSFPSAMSPSRRELTKLHEEVLRGPAAQLAEELRARGEVKGEIALVIAPPSEDEEVGIVPVGAAAVDPDEALREDIRAALEEGEPASAVAKRLSQKYSRRKRDVYAMVLDMQ